MDIEIYNVIELSNKIIKALNDIKILNSEYERTVTIKGLSPSRINKLLMILSDDPMEKFSIAENWRGYELDYNVDIICKEQNYSCHGSAYKGTLFITQK
jgi:hypothetical protein